MGAKSEALAKQFEAKAQEAVAVREKLSVTAQVALLARQPWIALSASSMHLYSHPPRAVWCQNPISRGCAAQRPHPRDVGIGRRSHRPEGLPRRRPGPRRCTE